MTEQSLQQIYMVVVALLIPAVMVIFGIRFIKDPPLEINKSYGYRTRRSMRSNAAWKFAHNYAGRYWLRLGLVVLPISAAVLVWLLKTGQDLDIVGALAIVQTLPLVSVIFFTERALKANFDDNGRPIER